MDKHKFIEDLDEILAGWRREREETQLTLGGMITALEAMHKDIVVVGLGDFLSYRGYYEDLSFQVGPDTKTVEQLLVQCREAIGATYEGYKGGNFVMGESTLLWIAPFGRTGVKIVSINKDGTLLVTEDDV